MFLMQTTQTALSRRQLQIRLGCSCGREALIQLSISSKLKAPASSGAFLSRARLGRLHRVCAVTRRRFPVGAFLEQRSPRIRGPPKMLLQSILATLERAVGALIDRQRSAGHLEIRRRNGRCWRKSVIGKMVVSANCQSATLNTNSRWGLVEGHADPLLLAPDDVTGYVRSVCLKDKVETLGNVVRFGNIERRSRNGHVADQAIYGAASELNRSRHQYRFARGRASFHETLMLEILMRGPCVESVSAQEEHPSRTPKKNRTRPALR
jgi:hypothetical protein